MLVAAAVCPHPPLLVSEVSNGAAGELDHVRAACDEAVRRVLATRLDLLVLVGPGPSTRTYEHPVGGSLAAYGVDVTVGDGRGELPLSLTIGLWLLGRQAGTAVLKMQSIAADAPAQRCLRLGADLAGVADRVGMLVLGDGSARRGVHAPGYVDPRAHDFDAWVARALRGGDPAALRALDPVQAEELLAGGRAAWQVLAGAADTHTFTAELLADEDPYGVCYLVASWSRDACRS